MCYVKGDIIPVLEGISFREEFCVKKCTVGYFTDGFTIGSHAVPANEVFGDVECGDSQTGFKGEVVVYFMLIGDRNLTGNEGSRV